MKYIEEDKQTQKNQSAGEDSALAEQLRAPALQSWGPGYEPQLQRDQRQEDYGALLAFSLAENM